MLKIKRIAEKMALQDKNIKVFKYLFLIDGEIINIGERLYEKGVRFLEKNRHEIAAYRKEQEKFENKIFTYQPNIYRDRSPFDPAKKPNCDPMIFEEKMQRYQQLKEQNLEKLREKYEDHEEFPFQPQIITK